MRDMALTKWRLGKRDAALKIYRELVPRADLLPNRDSRARVLLEAAHVAMETAGAQPAVASRLLDEALAYLREGSRDAHHRFEIDMAMSLVLALDRAGESAQADAILTEHGGDDTWAEVAAFDYLGNPNDVHALRGLATEQSQPAAAANHYREYLANPDLPFRATIQARLNRLTARLGTPGPRP
jgi:hypothetical protein